MTSRNWSDVGVGSVMAFGVPVVWGRADWPMDRDRLHCLGRQTETVEVMGRAAVVGVSGEVVESPVHKFQQRGVVGEYVKIDLDRGRAGWDFDVGTFPAVGEHDSAISDDFDAAA